MRWQLEFWQGTLTSHCQIVHNDSIRRMTGYGTGAHPAALPWRVINSITPWERGRDLRRGWPGEARP
jgi:hypothetical protein